jgi:hypothetical protein
MLHMGGVTIGNTPANVRQKKVLSKKSGITFGGSAELPYL